MRNRIIRKGKIVSEELIDPESGRYFLIEGNEVVEERDATQEEIESTQLAAKKTSKADIWRRATDAEAEVIDALLRDPPSDLGMSPVKLRRLWDDATSIDHTDQLFETIRAIAVQHFGEERADALLKPSE